jgi:hypothetical protein
MVRLTVEKYGKFVILVFDDKNTPPGPEGCFDEYEKIVANYMKSSGKVLFKIDEMDIDGLWSGLAHKWVEQRGFIHFVCANEEIEDIISFHFGPKATIHRTVEEAVNVLN